MTVLAFAGLNGEGWAIWCCIMVVGACFILPKRRA